MTQKVRVLNTGCPLSRLESARIENFFEVNQWEVVDDINSADLIIFRACGLLEYREDQARSIIRKIKYEKREEARFVVCGCLPIINPEYLKTEYDGITFSEKNIDKLNDLINANIPIKEVNAHRLISNYSYYPPTKKSLKDYFSLIYYKVRDTLEKPYSIKTSPDIYHIKVATGCLGNCTFCVQKKARGTVESKPIEDIVEEFKVGLDKGYKKISLLANDLGAYGRDQGYTLVDLLNKLVSIEGDFKIGLRNVEPALFIDMFDDLKLVFDSNKIWFLTSPVESGSDRILALMNRKYNICDYEKCVNAVKEGHPEIIFRTQIIVGFPSETEEDFQKSMELFDRVKFDWVEIFPFSIRLGTHSAEMPDQIPKEIIMNRYNRLWRKFWQTYFKRKIFS